MRRRYQSKRIIQTEKLWGFVTKPHIAALVDENRETCCIVYAD